MYSLDYQERLEQLEKKRNDLENELTSKKKFMEKMLEKHTNAIKEKTAEWSQSIASLQQEKVGVEQKLGDALACILSQFFGLG